jgi:hypothetical protein
VRCTDGGLVVEWVMMWGREDLMWRMRDARRSNLNDWFDSTIQRDIQIFEWSALRVQGSIANWDNLPPLTKSLIDALKIRKS